MSVIGMLRQQPRNFRLPEYPGVIPLQFESKCRARPLLQIASYADKWALDPRWISQPIATLGKCCLTCKEFRHCAKNRLLVTGTVGFYLRRGSRATVSPSFVNISQLRPFRRTIEETCTALWRSNG